MRKRNNEEASVSFSELLFDLIYVFAIIRLSHFLLLHLDWIGLIQETILWFAVWLVWQHTTWVTNWFNPDTRTIRILLFIIMLVGIFMAASIPEAYESRGLIFALCYVIIQVGRTLFVLIILDKRHELALNFRRILIWFCFSAVFWITGAFCDVTCRMVLWGIAVIIDYTSPMFGFYIPGWGRSDSKKEWNIEGHHLAERSQLFVIIAFGETILMTGDTLTEMENWNLPVVYAAIISFINSIAMWWIYFDVSSQAGSERIKKDANPGLLGVKYHSVHTFLVGTIIICAVGNELVIHNPYGVVNQSAIFTLIVGPILYLISNFVYKWLINKSIAWSHIITILALCVLTYFSIHFTLVSLNTATGLILLLLISYEIIKERRIIPYFFTGKDLK